MRNENLHQVVICNTQAKRLAVIDFETPVGEDWGAQAKSIAFAWMSDHDEPHLQHHFANGVMTVWVGGSTRCYPYN